MRKVDLSFTREEPHAPILQNPVPPAKLNIYKIYKILNLLQLYNAFFVRCLAASVPRAEQSIIDIKASWSWVELGIILVLQLYYLKIMYH